MVFLINNFDLAIIGAGPVGLFAANYAHLHGLKTIVFDAADEIGGQPAKIYPFKEILDIPVFNQITAKQLITNLSSNLSQTSMIITNHTVSDLVRTKSGFVIDKDFHVRSLIIASGNGAFSPKKLPVKTSPDANKRIHYFVSNPEIFHDQNVAILGGGDSALDWALELAQCANVKLIHRRNTFRGLESSINKLQKLKNVEILTPYLPKKLELRDNSLYLDLKEVGTKETLQLNLDQILVAYGFKANNNFVKNWGVELDGSHILVKNGMQTNVEGIYAIGDAVTYESRVPVIGVGFGEAQLAINNIMSKLFPDKNLTIHSTSM